MAIRMSNRISALFFVFFLSAALSAHASGSRDTGSLLTSIFFLCVDTGSVRAENKIQIDCSDTQRLREMVPVVCNGAGDSCASFALNKLLLLAVRTSDPLSAAIAQDFADQIAVLRGKRADPSFRAQHYALAVRLILEAGGETIGVPKELLSLLSDSHQDVIHERLIEGGVRVETLLGIASTPGLMCWLAVSPELENWVRFPEFRAALVEAALKALDGMDRQSVCAVQLIDLVWSGLDDEDSDVLLRWLQRQLERIADGVRAGAGLEEMTSQQRFVLKSALEWPGVVTEDILISPLLALGIAQPRTRKVGVPGSWSFGDALADSGLIANTVMLNVPSYKFQFVSGRNEHRTAVEVFNSVSWSRLASRLRRSEMLTLLAGLELGHGQLEVGRDGAERLSLLRQNEIFERDEDIKLRVLSLVLSRWPESEFASSTRQDASSHYQYFSTLRRSTFVAKFPEMFSEDELVEVFRSVFQIGEEASNLIGAANLLLVCGIPRESWIGPVHIAEALLEANRPLLEECSVANELTEYCRRGVSGAHCRLAPGL